MIDPHPAPLARLLELGVRHFHVHQNTPGYPGCWTLGLVMTDEAMEARGCGGVLPIIGDENEDIIELAQVAIEWLEKPEIPPIWRRPDKALRTPAWYRERRKALEHQISHARSELNEIKELSHPRE